MFNTLSGVSPIVCTLEARTSSLTSAFLYSKVSYTDVYPAGGGGGSCCRRNMMHDEHDVSESKRIPLIFIYINYVTMVFRVTCYCC